MTSSTSVASSSKDKYMAHFFPLQEQVESEIQRAHGPVLDQRASQHKTWEPQTHVNEQPKKKPQNSTQLPTTLTWNSQAKTPTTDNQVASHINTVNLPSCTVTTPCVERLAPARGVITNTWRLQSTAWAISLRLRTWKLPRKARPT